MSEYSRFMKKNKTVKPNTFYPATRSLCGEDGEPLKWEIKTISTRENERIQDACTIEVPIPGKANMFRQKVKTNEFAGKLIAACVVYPDLLNEELQDSYGVKTPEDLLKEMIDDAGEYNALLNFINEFNGFTPIQDEIEEAKN